ncbi:MAG: hypothetical protein U0746_14645 [Gemmataceae bacterium]
MREQLKSLRKHSPKVDPAHFRPGRPREVEKRADQSFETTDFLIEDIEVPPADLPFVPALNGRLDEDFDCSQWIADLVGDAGRHLPDCRQLLGTLSRIARLLEPIEHGGNRVSQVLGCDIQLADVIAWGRCDIHRPKLARDPSGRVFQAYFDLHDRPS